MKYNSDFRFDLKRGQDAEKWFGGLLTGDCIEVKRDFKAWNSGNVFVEFECGASHRASRHLRLPTGCSSMGRMTLTFDVSSCHWRS